MILRQNWIVSTSSLSDSFLVFAELLFGLGESDETSWNVALKGDGLFKSDHGFFIVTGFEIN